MISEKSEVKSKSIGSNTNIWQYVVVLQGAVIGENCNINAHCFIENDVLIGNNVTVKCGVYLWDGITIEDYVQIGPNVTFTNDMFPRAKKKFIIQRTRVEYGASVGANSTIIGGLTIGRFALIGAGSVVTRNVPNNTLWRGNPARQTGYVCNCGNKLDGNLRCTKCNSQYQLTNNVVSLK